MTKPKQTLITEEHVGREVIVNEDGKFLAAKLAASLATQLLVEWPAGGFSYFFRKDNLVQLKENDDA